MASTGSTALVALAVALLLQIIANLANDYFDFTNAAPMKTGSARCG